MIPTQVGGVHVGTVAIVCCLVWARAGLAIITRDRLILTSHVTLLEESLFVESGLLADLQGQTVTFDWVKVQVLALYKS